MKFFRNQYFISYYLNWRKLSAWRLLEILSSLFIKCKKVIIFSFQKIVILDDFKENKLIKFLKIIYLWKFWSLVNTFGQPNQSLCQNLSFVLKTRLVFIMLTDFCVRWRWRMPHIHSKITRNSVHLTKKTC